MSRATHSHTPENWLAAVPGLKVVSTATAYDAKGLMKSAIRDNDPVMFVESTLLYGERYEVPEEDILSLSAWLISNGKAPMVSLIAHGRSALIALKAASKSSPANTTLKRTCLIFVPYVRWIRRAVLSCGIDASGSRGR